MSVLEYKLTTLKDLSVKAPISLWTSPAYICRGHSSWTFSSPLFNSNRTNRVEIYLVIWNVMPFDALVTGTHIGVLNKFWTSFTECIFIIMILTCNITKSHTATLCYISICDTGQMITSKPKTKAYIKGIVLQVKYSFYYHLYACTSCRCDLVSITFNLLYKYTRCT